MNLFIDTSIFLSFYHLTSDDLEELRKLVVLLRKGEVTLLLPEQTKQEFVRNRESKIATALKSLREQSLNLQFPAMCRDYEEYELLREAQDSYLKNHEELLAKLMEDINKNDLKADRVISELFERAETISSKKELIELAKTRMAVGNPPGKGGSLGDALNWEALLMQVRKGEDLYLIAFDRDYFSEIEKGRPKEYLLAEWRSVKQADLFFYQRISDFFREHYPAIKLASELEKDLAVKELVTSPSFSVTHHSVKKLRQFDSFSPAQISALVQAGLNNSQVKRIMSDVDVHSFFSILVEYHRQKMDFDEYCEMVDLLDQSLVDEIPEVRSASIDEDDIPF